MGIRISTDDYGVKVWRSDKYRYPQYAVGIQGKDDDGKYVTEYQRVKFRRGVELENGSEIRIHDAFPTLEVWQDRQTGETRHRAVWMILDFGYINAAPKPAQPAPQRSQPEPQQLTWDGIPDSFAAAEDDIPF